ncbi:hypothetical protein RhiTH_009549 [Rhizoctonia solani]
MSPKSAVASKVAKPLDNNTPTNTPANKVAMDVDEPAVTPAPKQRGLMAVPGTLGTSAKKTKTGARKADNSKAPCYASLDKEDLEQSNYYYIGGKSLKPQSLNFYVGTVVAFLAYKGKGLGRQVAKLELYLGQKATHGQDFIGNPTWVRWTKGDSNQCFGNKKLPAYAMLDKECQAVIVNVSKGWIPSYNIGFVRSWLIDFDVEDVDINLLKLFIRLSCGTSKKSIEDQSRWEMRMMGAGNQKLLVLQLGEALTHQFNNGSTPVLAQIKAFNGCYVCWDRTSKPGDCHTAGNCMFLQKANQLRKKAGIDPIIIVDKVAILVVGEHNKLSNNAQLQQLETKNGDLRKQLQELTVQVDALEKKGNNKDRSSGWRRGQGGPYVRG